MNNTRFKKNNCSGHLSSARHSSPRPTVDPVAWSADVTSATCGLYIRMKSAARTAIFRSTSPPPIQKKSGCGQADTTGGRRSHGVGERGSFGGAEAAGGRAGSCMGLRRGRRRTLRFAMGSASTTGSVAVLQPTGVNAPVVYPAREANAAGAAGAAARGRVSPVAQLALNHSPPPGARRKENKKKRVWRRWRAPVSFSNCSSGARRKWKRLPRFAGFDTCAARGVAGLIAGGEGRRAWAECRGQRRRPRRLDVGLEERLVEPRGVLDDHEDVLAAQEEEAFRKGCYGSAASFVCSLPVNAAVPRRHVVGDLLPSGRLEHDCLAEVPERRRLQARPPARRICGGGAQGEEFIVDLGIAQGSEPASRVNACPPRNGPRHARLNSKLWS